MWRLPLTGGLQISRLLVCYLNVAPAIDKRSADLPAADVPSINKMYITTLD